VLGARCSQKASKYFLVSGLRRTIVTRYAGSLQNAQVSLFCHYRPVKISEIEGNQVRSKTAASYWLTRGYDLFSCACRNGKKGFQDRRIQPLCHSSVHYLTLRRGIFASTAAIRTSESGLRAKQRGSSSLPSLPISLPAAGFQAAGWRCRQQSKTKRTVQYGHLDIPNAAKKLRALCLTHLSRTDCADRGLRHDEGR
jgi:hypothetical protein